jgi:peptidyl-prolyl cis-trans isomerase SurA
MALAFVLLMIASSPIAQTSRSGGRGASVEIDGIAAVVNAEVITRAEVAARIDAVQAQLRSRGVELPPLDVLVSQVIDRMILDRVQFQRARELGVRVDDAQIDRIFESMAGERGLTPQAFRARIESEGVPIRQYLDQLRTDLLQSRLREREVDARIQISESDIDAFIAQRERNRAQEAIQLNLSQILVRVAEGASSEDIQRRRARAEEVLAMAQRPGADFAALVAAYSDAGDAMSGGTLGWRTVDRLPQLFVDAVRDQAVGAIVLTRSPNGFHLLKVNGRRSEQGGADLSAPIPQSRVRHLLVRIGGDVGEEQAFRRIGEIREMIVSRRTDFAAAAKAFSEDATAARGGDLDWILPGDTVPEFERAMDALKPGELSAPVRTAFGVHLLEVLERRVALAPPERLRAAARQALREQRIDEAWQDWLRQLRDRAYVEIRLDER